MTQRCESCGKFTAKKNVVEHTWTWGFNFVGGTDYYCSPCFIRLRFEDRLHPYISLHRLLTSPSFFEGPDAAAPRPVDP